MHPIESLPLELLSTIFIHSLPPIDCHDLGSASITTRYTIGYFGLVCRTWRDMTIRTPELWTDIRIDEESTFARTQLWLNRAVDRPLHIDIFIDDGDPQSEMERCLELLRSKGDQWSTLELSGRGVDEDDLQDLLPISLPNLTDASVVTWLDTNEFEPFNMAPKLQRVTLSGSGDGVFYFQSAPLVTHCSVSEFDEDSRWQDLITVLAEKSPLTETLQILPTTYHKEDMALDPTDPPWTPLNNLKKVIFEGCHRQTILYVLAHLTAPALETIQFSDLGSCHEFLTPIALPANKTIIINESRFFTIRRVLSKISNAKDVVIKVDLIDALKHVGSEIKAWEKDPDQLPETDTFEDMLNHFMWFAANARVEWTLPGGIAVDGSTPDAFVYAYAAFVTFTDKLFKQVLGGYSTQELLEQSRATMACLDALKPMTESLDMLEALRSNAAASK